MGTVKPLILSGRALARDLASLGAKRQSWRLQSPASVPVGDRDAALVAHHDDWELAHARGYKLAIGRDERPARASLSYVRLPAQFAELGYGDVLRIQPETGRVRVLYRRSSRHNFFLVTERCNNYCLMCSQPPKDIDDRWILEEIKESRLTHELKF